MIKTHKFMPADRYVFDFKLCKPSDGWAQIDTSQDASYYGHWANPFKLEIMGYVEGDVNHSKAENVQEFIDEINSLADWNFDIGYSFKIDALCNEDIINEFTKLGLERYLH